MDRYQDSDREQEVRLAITALGKDLFCTVLSGYDSSSAPMVSRPCIRVLLWILFHKSCIPKITSLKDYCFIVASGLVHWKAICDIASWDVGESSRWFVDKKVTLPKTIEVVNRWQVKDFSDQGQDLDVDEQKVLGYREEVDSAISNIKGILQTYRERVQRANPIQYLTALLMMSSMSTVDTSNFQCCRGSVNIAFQHRRATNSTRNPAPIA